MTPSPRAQNAPAPTDKIVFQMSRAEAEALHRRLSFGQVTPEQGKMLTRTRERLAAALEGPR